MDARFTNLRSAVFKLTNRCNIRCKYCYENIVAKGSDMSSEVFQRAMRAMLSSTSADSFFLILHGGEPTILPTEWFDENLCRACELADIYGKKIDITIQSNLIDVSDDKLDVFKKYNVSMGGSLDNPAFIKDSQRPLAEKALSTFVRAKTQGVRVGILATINSSNVHSMREFCAWLRDTLDVQHFKANVAYPVGAGLNLSVPSAQEIFSAQQSIIKFMLDTNGAVVEDNLCWEIVRFFENHLGGKKREGTLCDDNRCGAGSRVVGVAPDGSLMPCGRFAWNDSGHYLGGLDESEESGAAKFSERVYEFHSLNPENWLACARCEAASVCSFGCQAFIVRSQSRVNIECLPTKLRFAYYTENAEGLQPLYEKFCELQSRIPMSRLEQRLSKLRFLTPTEYRESVQRQLVDMMRRRNIVATQDDKCEI